MASAATSSSRSPANPRRSRSSRTARRIDNSIAQTRFAQTRLESGRWRGPGIDCARKRIAPQNDSTARAECTCRDGVATRRAPVYPGRARTCGRSRPTKRVESRSTSDTEHPPIGYYPDGLVCGVGRISKTSAARSAMIHVAGAPSPATVPGLTSQVRPPRRLSCCDTSASCECPQQTTS